MSVSGAEEICSSNREAEAESQGILAARRVLLRAGGGTGLVTTVYHFQHLAS